MGTFHFAGRTAPAARRFVTAAAAGQKPFGFDRDVAERTHGVRELTRVARGVGHAKEVECGSGANLGSATKPRLKLAAPGVGLALRLLSGCFPEFSNEGHEYPLILKRRFRPAGGCT